MSPCFRRALIAMVGVAFVSMSAGAAARAQDFPPKPGKEHKVLEQDVGTWDATIKSWTDPNAEPSESTGVEVNTLMPGGMWLLSEFKGDFAGMEFHGRGQSGYDPGKKKYVGTWIDSFGPGMIIQAGDYDEKTHTMTLVGEGFDPMAGKVVKYKTVSTSKSDGTRSMTMFTVGDDGKETKMMQIAYKKRK